ncbi:MAG: DUF2911 domain-containing protein [Bacteroidia bacterium]|nr:DUF2911 domain-containing protein [Bacteroidia bacterium]
MKKVLFTLCIMFAFVIGQIDISNAQLKTPAPSPKGKISQDVGLMTINIEYSRPGVKDRKIYGELVPYGEMWRTGANASTKIEFTDDATINGSDIEKGKYALYMIPGETEWEVVLHKNLSYWGTGGDDYKLEEDAMRFKVKPQRLTSKVETMTINVANVKSDNAEVQLDWENTRVAFTVGTDVETKVMKEIETKMAGISARTYFDAARYYYNTDKDLDKALTWVDKAQEKEQKFWMMRLKAQIQAKMKDYKGAIKTAELSTQLAEEAGNKSYPRMNKKSIEEWSKM